MSMALSCFAARPLVGTRRPGRPYSSVSLRRCGAGCVVIRAGKSQFVSKAKKNYDEAMKKAQGDRKKAREAWLAKLTRNFGDDEGNEITFNGTVVQALLMMNGRELQAELSRPMNNTVGNAFKSAGSAGMLDELTLAALGRKATLKERDVLRREKIKGNEQWFWEDVLWALLNSNEFILNH